MLSYIRILKGKCMNYFIEGITTKYADFSGRARRKEYWMFALFYVLLYTIISIVANVLPESVGSLVLLVFVLGLFIPCLSALVRRLHDTGRSGWWILLQIIPIIGPIVIFIFCVLDGEPTENEYGPNPKATL